jgi:hypothetical protein
MTYSDISIISLFRFVNLLLNCFRVLPDVPLELKVSAKFAGVVNILHFFQKVSHVIKGLNLIIAIIAVETFREE